MSSIPIYGRASDIRTLALGTGCEGSWVLNHLYRDELPDAVWFILGTTVHETIERAILENLPEEDAQADCLINLDLALGEADGNVIESASPRAKRGLDTIYKDAAMLVSNWYADVHPDSETRNPIFDEYEWPPTVEHNIALPDEGLFTQVDAIFHSAAGDLVVDWKTGNSKHSHESQLHIYRYGLLREGYNLDDTRVGMFWHVAHSKPQWVYDYVGDEIVDTWIKKTRAHKYLLVDDGLLPTFNPDWICGYCVAKPKCPIWGKGNLEEIGIDITSAELHFEPEGEEDV